MDTPEEIAKMMKTKWDLGLNGGVLVTNPIPEEYSLDEDVICKSEIVLKDVDDDKYSTAGEFDNLEANTLIEISQL